MDDRCAEYVIAVGQLCAAAALAEFRLEVLTATGRVIAGMASAPRTAVGDAELDHTGLQRTVTIDGAPVNLDEIARCTVHSPELTGAPAIASGPC